MRDNLRLIVIDELNEEFCLASFKLPCAEELTRDEVACFEEAMLTRVVINPECQGYYWIEDFTTKTDREEAEQRMLLEIQAIMKDLDVDEEEAYDIWVDDQRADDWF